MNSKDRLPIAQVPAGRWQAIVYFVCAAAIAAAFPLVASHLMPIVASVLLAGFLTLMGAVLLFPVLFPKYWQSRAYAQWRDVMPCYISVQDRNLNIIDVNDLFLREFGERLRHRCYRVYKDSDERCSNCPVLETFKDGKVHTSEETVINGRGDEIDVVVTSAPLLDNDNRVAAVVEMFTDVTEIKQLEKELEKTRRDYQRLFDVVPCYICVVNRELEIIESNALYRWDFDLAKGTHCYEACKARKSPCHDCLVGKTFENEEIHASEETLTTKHGRQVNVIAYSMPIRDDNQEIKAVMEVFTDITQVKHLQRQLTLMGRAVAGMAHRIKNILMGLEGGIFVVNTGMETDDKEMLNEGWEMVQRNVGHVSRLVLDLLYCSKKRVPTFKDDISPQEVAEEVADLYRRRLAEDEIELKLELTDPPHRGIFDPDALHNLFGNLVANALDACRFDLDESKPSHTIVVKCLTDEAGKTVVEVTDNGAGIPEDVQDKVFEDFFSTKGTEGTGMGLLVVQKVAEEHGGKVTFDTELGKGTTFRVILPALEEPNFTSMTEL